MKSNKYVIGYEFVVDKMWIDFVVTRHLSQEHEN